MNNSHWPEGRNLAISVNVLLEQWSDGAAPDPAPMGAPLRSGALDTQARSWAAYGANAGARRLLDVLAVHRVKAVFYVSGLLAERDPELLREIRQAGHAVACHGWAQDMVPAYLSRQEEARALDRSTAAIGAATGERPRGYLSPRATPSLATPELLAERGYLWHADAFDADTPYWTPTSAGDLVAMPFTLEINDLEMAARYGPACDAFPRALQFILDGAAQIAARPACLDLTVHAHIFGGRRGRSPSPRR